MGTSGPRDTGVDIVRILVGRPRLWTAAVATGLGVTWLILGACEGFTFPRTLMAVVWLALGLGQGTVAVVDRVHRRGRSAVEAPRA